MHQAGRNVEKIVESVFEEYHSFDDLRSFYNAVCTEGYKYVIIVPRKCLTEYKCLLTLDKQQLDFGKTVCMTTKGFVRYKKQIQEEIKSALAAGKDLGKYIMVVDDIIIYGRGINHFLKCLYSCVDTLEEKEKLIESISLKVFIESNNEFQIDNNFQSIIDERYEAYNTYYYMKDVKRTSDLFLKSFYATVTPNTSFIRSWLVKQDRIQILFEKVNNINDKLKVYDLEQNADQKKYEFITLILTDDSCRIFDRISEFCCIRIYFNGERERLVFTPYVFLNPMSAEQLDCILISVQECFSSIIKKDSEFICAQTDEKGEVDKDYYVLKYEYLTMIMSDFYGIYIWEKYFSLSDVKWQEYFEDDADVLSFSFGKENLFSVSEMIPLVGSDGFERFTDCISKIEMNSLDHCFTEEKDALCIMDEMVKEEHSNDVRTFVSQYFSRNHDEDEVRAYKRIDRIEGISTGTMWEQAEKHNLLIDKAELYKEILSCMDDGKATLTIKPVYDENMQLYFAAVLNAGEQAYRISIDYYMPFFKYFAKIESDCRNLLVPSRTEKIINDFLKAALNERIISKKMKEDIEKIRRKMRLQGKEYGEMYVTRKGCEEIEEQKLEKIYQELF